MSFIKTIMFSNAFESSFKYDLLDRYSKKNVWQSKNLFALSALELYSYKHCNWISNLKWDDESK